MDALSDTEKAGIVKLFPPQTVTIDGQEYESIGIVLIVRHNGKEDHTRYTFFNDQDVWKLHQIEEGVYVES